MDPMYSCGATYPYQGDQMQYWPHNFPGSQAGPAQMYVSPARPPISYGSWPWGNNYGYGGPVACHGCGNHNYFPSDYAWRPPYSPVSPVHCHGNCPFPMQYMPPPPPAMQQPQYGYESNMHRNHHCCGCANHPSHQKEQKSLRIEEEEPDGDRRKNDSLDPFKFKNCPYPIVWLPPEYGNNKDQRKLTKSEKDEGDGFQDVKAHEDRRNVEQRPTVWNKWYPNDLEKLVSSNQRGDGDRNTHQEDEGKRRFQFPIFWIPYEPGEIDQKANKENNVVQEPRLESVKGSDVEQNSDVNGEHAGGRLSSKPKDIPVKQAQQHAEKESNRGEEKEREMKSPEDSPGRKTSSPPKSSKLPPVCLRVDPLPRKKTSRSPSPPGDKQKRDQIYGEAGKVSPSSDNVKVIKDESKEVKGIITKNIEVANRKSSQGDENVDGPANNKPLNSPEDISKKEFEGQPKEVKAFRECFKPGVTIGKDQSAHAGSLRGEKVELAKDVDETSDKAKKYNKPKLTDEQAAIIIQSMYRGYDIRRWEPVKKLKQIAKVREQINDVKQRIQAFELSSDIQNNSKERNIIAEIIMSLLLKLDTIQGLHPSIRDVRKSVVKELVGLQEKLDSLISEKSKALPGTDSVRHDEQACEDSVEIMSPERAEKAKSDSLEPCEKNLEVSDQGSITEQVTEILEKTGADSLESCAGEGTQVESEPAITIETQNEEMDKDGKLSTANIMEELENEDVALCNSYAEVSESASKDGHRTGYEVTELLQGVAGDSCTQGGTDNLQFEEDTNEVDDAKHLKEMSEAPVSKDEIAVEVNKEDSNLHGVLDLPLAQNNILSEDQETSTEKEVVNKVEDDTANETFQPNETLDKIDIRTEEAHKENDAICDQLQGDSGVLHSNSSSMLEALEKSPEEGIVPDHIAREMQEMSPIDDSANIYGLTGLIGEKEYAEEKSEGDIVAPLGQNVEDLEELEKTEANPVSPEDAPENMEVLSDMMSPLENPKAQHLETSTGNERNAAVAGDDPRDSNGALIEENQKLREMMEKLIKSGEEQLATISALSGRVKDLERKLSKKRKLKMKQCKGTKSGSRELHELMAV